MTSNEEQNRKRTPFSAKLPQVALDEALESVQVLAELGAPATPHVIAQHAGTSYSTDARFRTRLGSAGYYGLIEKQGDKRALTERGAIITGVGNGDPARARREAVINTSFGPLIYSLRSRPVNESAIARRLQGDHGVPEASAPKIARALIGAATQAGLIENDRFDAVAIEQVAGALPAETPSPPTTAAAKPQATTKSHASATSQAKEQDQPKLPQPEVQQQRPFVPGIQVVVKIDASSLGPQEIAELVRALQAPS